MLSTHYRAMLNFSFELMESSKASLQRIDNCINNLKFLLKNKNISEGANLYFDNINDLNELLESAKIDDEMLANEKEQLEKVSEFVKIYFDKLDDDFNTADAETQIYEIVRIINQSVNENSTIVFINSLLLIVNTLLNILGIYSDNVGAEDDAELKEKVEKMLEDRKVAKVNKDYAKADAIRKELLEMGIEIEDTRTGVKWKKV